MKRYLAILLIIIFAIFGISYAATITKGLIGVQDISWKSSGTSRQTFTRLGSSSRTLTLNQPDAGDLQYRTIALNLEDTVDGGFGTIDPRSFSSGDLSAALTACTNHTMILNSAITLDANSTFPVGCKLVINEGGSLAKASTYTLTINGPFQAGLYTVFTGFSSGNVTFGVGAVEGVHPEWWGAVADGSTDDTTAINQAVNAYDKVLLVGGETTIYIADGITLITNSILTGNATLKHKNTAAGDLIAVTSANTDIVIEGLNIDGNRANNNGNAQKLIDLTNGGNNITIRNNKFQNAEGVVIYIDQTGATEVSNLRIDNNLFNVFESNAITWDDTGTKSYVQSRIVNNTFLTAGQTPTQVIELKAGANSGQLVIESNIFKLDSGVDGISLGTNGVNITDNQFTGGDNNIVTLAGILDGTLNDNKYNLWNTSFAAVKLIAVNYFSVSDSQFIGDTGGKAIEITDSAGTPVSYVNLEDNMISNVDDGILVGGTGGTHLNVKISGNNMKTGTGTGIDITRASSVFSITDNIIDAFAESGIDAGALTSGVISDNILKGNNTGANNGESGMILPASSASLVVSENVLLSNTTSDGADPFESEIINSIQADTRSRTLELTQAQIQAMEVGEGIELVPAPGAGKLLVFMHLYMSYDNDGANPFVVGNADNLARVQYDTTQVQVSQHIDLNDFIDQAVDETRMAYSEAVSIEDIDFVTSANKALQLFNESANNDVTAGADDQVTVTITYMVLEVDI